MMEFSVKVPEGYTIMQGKAYIEAQYIEWVYAQSRYNQSRAAISLGMSRGCFRAKLKEHFGAKYL